MVRRQKSGAEDERMSWLVNVLIGVLAVALVALVVIRIRLKRRLDSIDGMVGVTRRGGYDGKIVGGEFTKVYKHKQSQR
ncbi:MAG: hypothetical protein GX417_05305 [Clostridiales bacterium]|nr:hypothetical protein [Clostridiales bacterium]